MDEARNPSGPIEGDSLDRDLVALRAELDARSERDEGRWTDQRRAIRRLLAERPARERSPGPRSPRLSPRWLRPVWAAPALAAALLGVALLLPGHRQDVVRPDPPSPSTAELLRSVEATLSADPAASLSPAGLLVAELEEQYAALQDSE